jgi:repressor LexA
MGIGDRIRQFRLARELTQEQVAQALGVDRSMVARYERGTYRVKDQLILPLANILGVQPNDLFGDLPTNAQVGLTEVRVLGHVAADKLSLAEQDVEGFELVPSEMVRGGDYYCLRVEGDCMAPQIPDGSFALVREQPDVEDGEPAVVCVGSEEGTLKRVYRMQGDTVLLKADNPSIPPILVNASEVRVKGKVTAVISKVK